MAKINCSKTASEILKHYYGYDSFRPLQAEIIGSVLQGEDSLVLMPTGGGKSLCFQIPALILQGMAIVVSPLISLMKDQVAALQGNGIAAEALNSGNDERENMAIKTRCEHGDIKLLYTSPERLLSELEWIKGNIEVSFFAIDEAHCISQWGHDFRPEYAQLERLREEFAGVPVIALTATADKITKGDILEKLHIDPRNQYVSSFDRPNLSLDVKRGYSSRDKLTAILNMIKRHQGESGIIYCLSRKNTEEVALKLKLKGIKAEAYHAGQSITKRNSVQDDFLNDRIDVVVATIAFGMGIDKSNVRYVIHYNLPKSIESFFQEIGRGGRDGLPCETLLFYNIQDLITLRSFADNSGQQDINHEKLNRMQEYAEAQVCRRRILLNYFGEPSDHGCGNCDVCLNPPVRFDGTVPVQMALSAIMRTGQNATSRMIIEILVGSVSRELRNKGYDRLKTYGAGRAIPFRDWQDYMLQILQMGYFEIAYNEDNHLKVTTLGQDVLYGRAKAELVVIDRTAGDTKPRKEKKETESRKGSARKKPAELPGLTDDNKEDKQLFEALRGLRREIADELGVPAFVVMSDRTLHALAIDKPLTREAFATIHGIGEHKSARYGARFIQFIKEHIDIP